MNFRKITMLVTLGMFLLYGSTFAYKNAFEPESDTAVSYSTYSVEKQSTEVVFTKYATADPNQDEYWIRLSRRQNREKVLHYITLNIDGTDYRLTAFAPDYHHVTTAESTIDQEIAGLFAAAPLVRSGFKYFSLTPEIITKLSTAKHVYLIYSRLNRINMKYDLPDDFLKAIQQNNALEFVDFSKYWKPEVAENAVK
jgi:hypothetical protein